MQAEISNTRGEDSSRSIVTPITFLPSSFRSPPVGPQVNIRRSKVILNLLLRYCVSKGVNPDNPQRLLVVTSRGH